MRLLDLFSGIGGFSLGLERAGFQTVAFCEIDPFCRRVLEKHWPHVPCYDDVTTLTAARLAADGIGIDAICGGFPCQPFSSAARGRIRGRDDDRWIWPEMHRLVEELQPSWVICENVVNIDGLALDEVVSDMEAIGYEIAPIFEIPACAVGHDHWRPRLWIVGHSDRKSQSRCAVDGKMAGMPEYRCFARSMGTEAWIPRRMDRLRALGNAIVPQIAEIIGRAIMETQTQARFNG